MDCSRYIGYLDNYCKGLKMSVAGVVRMDCVGQKRSLWISAKPTEKCEGLLPIYLINGVQKKKLGETAVVAGNIVTQLNGVEDDWNDYYGIEIPISENWSIVGNYKEPLVTQPKQEIIVEEAVANEAVVTEMVSEEIRPEEPAAKEITIETIGEEPEAATKWDKLFWQFPKRIPFSNGKKYLEISLSDLIILPERQYALTKNPFLVYGFKQYGYLLLEKIGQDKYHNYRLGVPGIYHPKEIQAAMRYGFDSFESEKSSPDEGEQGVYFTTVSL